MMTAALLPWIALMLAGFVAGILLLIWGFRSGQFSEQDRARFLPLRDSRITSPADEGHGTVRQLYLFLVLMTSLSLFLIVAFLITILNKGPG